MNDAVEYCEPVRVAEHQRAQPRPVQSAVGTQHVLPEGLHHAGKSGVPGSTTSRARASASTSTAPSSRKREATTDFPEAMPPVNPIFSTPPD